MYRLMLVDDEQSILSALQRILRPIENYEVEAFTSPNDALARVRAVQFDLVLADYRLPEMDGIALLKKLNALQPEVPCIMISGCHDSELLLSAINEVNAFRFISKPWDSYALLDTVAQALAERTVRAKLRSLEDKVSAQETVIREQARALQGMGVELSGTAGVDPAAQSALGGGREN